VEVGSFLLTRLLPLGSAWMLSGTQLTFPAESRPAVAQMVAEGMYDHPELVLRNPDNRRTALETARSMHESFLGCFGSDLLVVPGSEVTSTYRRFIAHHTARVSPDRDAAALAELVVDAAVYDETFGAVETVGVRHRPDSGIWFFADYGVVGKTFEEPRLVVRDRVHRDAVRGYLEDDTIPPWVLEELCTAHPGNADQVFRAVLGRPRFSWAADGQELLRRHKPSYFRRRYVSPGVIPTPAIALEYLQSPA
jgi:hypothetical protein